MYSQCGLEIIFENKIVISSGDKLLFCWVTVGTNRTHAIVC